MPKVMPPEVLDLGVFEHLRSPFLVVADCEHDANRRRIPAVLCISQSDNPLIKVYVAPFETVLLYLHAYASVHEARTSIGRYLQFYNSIRPRSSLKARSPDQVSRAPGLFCNNALRRTLVWTQLTGCAHASVTAVALANKLVRIACAVLAKDEPYRPAVLTNDCSLTGLQRSPG